MQLCVSNSGKVVKPMMQIIFWPSLVKTKVALNDDARKKKSCTRQTMIVSIKSAGKLKGTKISAPLCTLSDAMQIELPMFAAIAPSYPWQKNET